MQENPISQCNENLKHQILISQGLKIQGHAIYWIIIVAYSELSLSLTVTKQRNESKIMYIENPFKRCPEKGHFFLKKIY